MKQKTDDEDIINSPSHYIEGRKIEPIDVIEDWELDGDYYLGNVIKYISRYRRKLANYTCCQITENFGECINEKNIFNFII